MAYDEDALLARELGKIGKASGRLAGKLNDGPEGATGAAASWGARMAARFLPTEQHRIELAVERDAETILATACAVLARHGRVADDWEVGDSSVPTVSGVIGSGWLKLNPAVVHVELVEVQEARCTVRITAGAKEGLIKQHSARRAAQRVAHALQAVL